MIAVYTITNECIVSDRETLDVLKVMSLNPQRYYFFWFLGFLKTGNRGGHLKVFASVN